MRRLWILAAVTVGCLAQDSSTFEAASVKPADTAPGAGGVRWMRGGPGTGDPTRIDYHNVSLSQLICRAYGVEEYQVVGPDWLRRERYEVAARVAPGTTKDQFQSMLRHLLADRFKLQSHREQKEMGGYSLTVAKGGPKLKAHVEPPPEGEPQPFGSKTDRDGYPVVPRAGAAQIDGRARIKDVDIGMEGIANWLSLQLALPVNDLTGLTGKYDFDLFWSTRPPDVNDTGPDLITAVQQQLGLKLERTKAPVEVLVIDRVERTPTAN